MAQQSRKWSTLFNTLLDEALSPNVKGTANNRLVPVCLYQPVLQEKGKLYLLKPAVDHVLESVLIDHTHLILTHSSYQISQHDDTDL